MEAKDLFEKFEGRYAVLANSGAPNVDNTVAFLDDAEILGWRFLSAVRRDDGQRGYWYFFRREPK